MRLHRDRLSKVCLQYAPERIASRPTRHKVSQRTGLRGVKRGWTEERGSDQVAALPEHVVSTSTPA